MKTEEEIRQIYEENLNLSFSPADALANTIEDVIGDALDEEIAETGTIYLIYRSFTVRISDHSMNLSRYNPDENLVNFRIEGKKNIKRIYNLQGFRG